MKLNIRFIVLFIGLFIIPSIMNGIDFEKIDKLNHDGNDEEALNLLLVAYKENSTDPAILWRISREYYEIGDKIPAKNKKEKIETFNKGMDIVSAHIQITQTKKKVTVTISLPGNKNDIAPIPYWYAVNLGSRGQEIGIKESLDTIPVLFALGNKSQEINPQFSQHYILRANIDARLPEFMGGDKFRMGYNFIKAIETSPTDIYILVEACKAFYLRNWSIEKKKKMFAELGKTDGTDAAISDRDHAFQLCKTAISTFEGLKDPSVRDKKQYQEALNMLKKFK